MVSCKALVSTAFVALSLSALTAQPAAAGSTSFLINDLRKATPSCAAAPSAPVKGYVSGTFSGDPPRGAGFVGCFASLASCDVWRKRTSGQVHGRLILNRCEAR